MVLQQPPKSLDMESEMPSEEATRITATMFTKTTTNTTRTTTEIMVNLHSAHRQSLPAGVDIHEMTSDGTYQMPPLETPTEMK